MTEAGFTAEQCRRYALSLPISVLACGIQSPVSEEEMQDMEDRVYDQATDGRYEWFKSTQYFDSQYHRAQHGFPVFD